MPVFSSNLDSTNWVLSLLSSWSGAKNLYVPIPADVVPNPTILDLTLIGLDLVLVTLNDKMLLPIPESYGLNVAKKFELNVPWLESKYDSVKYVFVASLPTKCST